jgi:SAM-dependent methyltransferase
MEANKLNIGSGRIRMTGFVNIDKTQIIDGNGDKMVDIILDIEKEPLPFPDNSIEEIAVENILEHLGDGLIPFLNECHRVLKADGVMWGNVPPFGTNGAVRDITHKRFFVKDSFDYFTGKSLANSAMPKAPKYADYGVKPWYKLYLDDGIKFKLRPRKTIEYVEGIEQDNIYIKPPITN